MPIVLLVAGGMLLASALTGQTSALGQQVRADFTGQKSFLYWLAAIIVIGSIGYVKRLEEVSRAFLALILLAMVLKNGTGVAARFEAAIAAPPLPPPQGSVAPAAPTTASGSAQTVSGNGVATSQSPAGTASGSTDAGGLTGDAAGNAAVDTAIKLLPLLLL